MECFNCGNDADMEIVLMVNGELKKIHICMDCYKESMQDMLDDMMDEDGNIDPEKIQKRMFEFFENNKEAFYELFGNEDGINPNMNIFGQNFNMETNPKDFMEFLNKFKQNEEFKDKPKTNRFGFDPYKEYKNKPGEYNKQDSANRQIASIQNTLQEKKKTLMKQLDQEDYLAAATSRDEIKEMNRRIIKLRLLQKEVD